MLATEAQKQLAARWAAEHVTDGMLVGLGTGSTATLAVRALAERVRQGLHVTGVATSATTEQLARSLGIKVIDLDEGKTLDVAIDGADEVDAALNLIKGLGGALLREKLVELTARDLTIIVDEGKLVPVLGYHSPVPVEIVPYGWRWTRSRLEALGCQAEQRLIDGEVFLTDGGHYILDCQFGPLADAPALAQQLKAISGVIEHGLFLGLATRVVIGKANGSVEIRTR
ncbi:MAG TPA: ribose-5-phosphate isomerase RpiA [Chloroflexota bacterium]